MDNELLVVKFRRALEDKIATAQVDLSQIDGFLPLVISSTLSGVEEAVIDFDETPKDAAAELLRKYVTSPDVEAIGLIFMANTVCREASDNRPIAEELKNEPDMSEAIMAYLFTKETSEYRRIKYKKKDEGNYTFFDEGWMKPTTFTGRFANPFKK